MRILKRGLVGILITAMPFFASIASKAQGITNISETVNSNIITTLNWEDQYKVAATSSGNGYLTGNTNDWITENGSASITAHPNQYFQFVGWIGVSNTNQNPLVLANITNAYNIIANFSEIRTQKGVPHSWFGEFGITNNISETANDDGDAYNNLEEYIANTNPTNPASYFHVEEINLGNPPSLSIPESSTGRMYTVYSTTDLTATPTAETNSLGNGGKLDLIIKQTEDPQKFYRVKVSIPQ